MRFLKCHQADIYKCPCLLWNGFLAESLVTAASAAVVAAVVVAAVVVAAVAVVVTVALFVDFDDVVERHWPPSRGAKK